MSQFDFIATSDNELKEVKGLENDYLLNDFHVCKVVKDETYRDVDYYTELPYIYEVYWKADKNKCQELIDYLRANMKHNKKYELYCISLANARNRKTYKNDIKKGLEDLKRITLDICDADSETIKELYDQYQYLRIKFYKSKKY